MKLTTTICLLLAVGFLSPGCKEMVAVKQQQQAITLKSAFADDFVIGTALNRRQITQSIPEAAALIPKEFNSITAENSMKWMHIHPKPDTFNFELPDAFVEYGQQYHMFIVGHTLVWHSQLARWARGIEDPDEMKKHLENHIRTIVGRYKGKVHGWDVVNEAINGDGSLRESVFLKTLGEDYLKLAFDLAAKADPEAELYYNDYSLTNPTKRAGVIRMVKKLQQSGTNIDGIGMQAHWGLNYPGLEEIEQSIIEYAALGVKVMITEMDITVIPNPGDIEGADVNQTAAGNDLMNPYTAGLPDSIQTQLAQRYEDIFKIFLKHADKISRVTFWGVNDGQSWKNNWPIRGRTNYPLLFDREYKPKAAYHRVIALKEKQKESS